MIYHKSNEILHDMIYIKITLKYEACTTVAMVTIVSCVRFSYMTKIDFLFQIKIFIDNISLNGHDDALYV